MAGKYIDFKELKKAVPIVDVLQWLKFDLKPKGPRLRGECPFCERGGDRAFVVTPAENTFCCHGGCEPKPGKEAYGGDIIELVSRHFNCAPREAAIKIAEQFGFGNSNSEQLHR